jgi:hypothetical protein
MLKETFGSHKPIVGMVHILPLPGSPLYDSGGGMSRIVDAAARDIEALKSGGVDAMMFGNEGDRPYLLKASPISLAAMAHAIGELKRLIDRHSASITSGTRSPAFPWPWRAELALRARSSRASMIPTWDCGRQTPLPPCACAPIVGAPT